MQKQNRTGTGVKAPSAGKTRAVFSSRRDCEERLSRYFGTYLRESGEIADIEGLADYLGTTRDVLIALLDSRAYGVPLKRAWNRIAKMKKQLAFQGKLPAAVLSFDLKNNHGYRDRPEEQQENGSGITVVFRGETGEWAK